MVEVAAVDPTAGATSGAVWTPVKVGGEEVSMMVDTGAAVSIVPTQLYEAVFSFVPLKPTKTVLQAYGGNPLTVRGVMQIPVRAENGLCADAELFVVDAATPLLGRDLLKSLQLSIRHGECVFTVDRKDEKTDVKEEHLPAIKGFVHRVNVNPDVQPVQQRLTPLYARRWRSI